MKYVITESRLNHAIYEYIDQSFASENGNTEINRLPSLDENGEEINNAYDFANDDYYSNTGADDYLFAWTGKEYYESLTPSYITRSEFERLSSKAPLVEIYDTDILRQLNGYFGDKWKPVFKQWFKDKTGMDYKTIYEVPN